MNPWYNLQYFQYTLIRSVLLVPVSHFTCLPSSPDLFKYRLISCRLINSTFLHNKEGCLLSDISDENNAYMVYFVSFLGTLAVLPGNIVSALLMDKIGRLRMLGKTAAACGVITVKDQMILVPLFRPQRAPA